MFNFFENCNALQLITITHYHYPISGWSASLLFSYGIKQVHDVAQLYKNASVIILRESFLVTISDKQVGSYGYFVTYIVIL